MLRLCSTKSNFRIATSFTSNEYELEEPKCSSVSSIEEAGVSKGGAEGETDEAEPINDPGVVGEWVGWASKVVELDIWRLRTERA